MKEIIKTPWKCGPEPWGVTFDNNIHELCTYIVCVNV